MTNPKKRKKQKNPAIPKEGRGTLIHAVKLAYRKIHLGDDDLTDNEVGDALLDALCNELGDNGFQTWLRIVAKKVKP